MRSRASSSSNSAVRPQREKWEERSQGDVSDSEASEAQGKRGKSPTSKKAVADSGGSSKMSKASGQSCKNPAPKEAAAAPPALAAEEEEEVIVEEVIVAPPAGSAHPAVGQQSSPAISAATPPPLKSVPPTLVAKVNLNEEVAAAEGAQEVKEGSAQDEPEAKVVFTIEDDSDGAAAAAIEPEPKSDGQAAERGPAVGESKSKPASAVPAPVPAPEAKSEESKALASEDHAKSCVLAALVPDYSSPAEDCSSGSEFGPDSEMRQYDTYKLFELANIYRQQQGLAEFPRPPGNRYTWKRDWCVNIPTYKELLQQGYYALLSRAHNPLKRPTAEVDAALTSQYTTNLSLLSTEATLTALNAQRFDALKEQARKQYHNQLIQAAIVFIGECGGFGQQSLDSDRGLSLLADHISAAEKDLSPQMEVAYHQRNPQPKVGYDRALPLVADAPSPSFSPITPPRDWGDGVTPPSGAAPAMPALSLDSASSSSEPKPSPGR